MIRSTQFRRRVALAAIGWFLSLLLAWPITGAFRAVVMHHAGKSLFLEHLKSSMDASFWWDLVLNESSGAMLPWLIIPVVGGWLLFQPGFSAWVMRNRQQPGDSMMTTATDAFRRWPGMVGVSLVYSVLAGVVVVAFSMVIALVVAVFEAHPSQEMMPIWLSMTVAGMAGAVILVLMAARLMTSALYVRGERLRVALFAPLTAGWGYWGRMLLKTLGLLLLGGALSFGLSMTAVVRGENPLWIQFLMQIAIFVHVLCKVVMMEMYAGAPPAFRIRSSSRPCDQVQEYMVFPGSSTELSGASGEISPKEESMPLPRKEREQTSLSDWTADGDSATESPNRCAKTEDAACPRPDGVEGDVDGTLTR